MKHLTANDIMELQSVKQSGAFGRLVEEVKEDLAFAIIGTKLNEIKGREDLYMLAATLEELQKKLEEHITDYNNNQEAE